MTRLHSCTHDRSAQTRPRQPNRAGSPPWPRGGRRSGLAAVAIVAVVSFVAGFNRSTPAFASAAQTAPSAEAAANSVAFFGDSIGHSAEPETRARLVDGGYRVVDYNSVNGYTVGDQAGAIRRRVTGPNPPHTLIIELGTNDAEKIGNAAAFEEAVRATLDTVSPRVACVRWLDIKPTPTNFYLGVNRNAPAFNRILARVTATYPNVEVAHYSAWAAATPDASFIDDGLHLAPTGRREFGRLVRQAADGCNPAVATGVFWDVPDASAEAPAVNWMASAGITAGYPNETFRARIASLRPGLARIEFARWLWRMAGRPAATSAGWTDTTGDTRPADWMVAAGIIARPVDGRFLPDRLITRNQAARYLWAYAGAPTSAAAHTWADSPAVVAYDWATETGILPGFPDGTYRPSRSETRLTLAKAIYRLHLLLTPGETTPTSTAQVSARPVTTDVAGPTAGAATNTTPNPVATTTTAATEG